MTTVKQMRNTGPMIAARRKIAAEGEIAKARAVLEKHGFVFEGRRVIEPPASDNVKANTQTAE